MTKTQEKIIPVRFNWPERTHKKILTYQAALVVRRGKKVTFEEALISFIDASETHIILEKVS